MWPRAPPFLLLWGNNLSHSFLLCQTWTKIFAFLFYELTVRVFAMHMCRVAINQVLMSGQRHWAVARLYPVLFLEVSLSERLSCLLMNRSCSITSLIGSPSDLLPEMLVLQTAQLSHGFCAASTICPQISPYQAQICRYLSLSSHSYLFIPPFSSVPTPHRHQSLTSPHPLSPRCVSHRLSEHGGSVVVAHVFFGVRSVRDGADRRDLEKDRWKWTSKTRDL